MTVRHSPKRKEREGAYANESEFFSFHYVKDNLKCNLSYKKSKKITGLFSNIFITVSNPSGSNFLEIKAGISWRK
jgi:hypothetical protein